MILGHFWQLWVFLDNFWQFWTVLDHLELILKIFNNFPTTALELILVNKNKKKILRTSNVPIHGPRKSPRNFQYTMKSRRDSCLLWHYIYGTPCRQSIEYSSIEYSRESLVDIISEGGEIYWLVVVTQYYTRVTPELHQNYTRVWSPHPGCTGRLKNRK